AFASLRPSAAPGTFSLCFDPLGRPQQIVGANGSSVTKVDRSAGGAAYGDTDESVTASCVDGSLSPSGLCAGGASAQTSNVRDAFGRLVSVAEPAVAGSSFNLTTAYQYDVLDKLTRVTQQDDSGTTQVRTFVYDRFGFLRSEATPERGQTG